MTSGSVVLGIISGLIISFLAVGVVLVYKANRFLNLAHAQFGVFSAIFLEKGEVRFEGPTAQLLENDDIARAVFLGGER